jgi:hypothetical protein
VEMDCKEVEGVEIRHHLFEMIKQQLDALFAEGIDKGGASPSLASKRLALAPMLSSGQWHFRIKDWHDKMEKQFRSRNRSKWVFTSKARKNLRSRCRGQ